MVFFNRNFFLEERVMRKLFILLAAVAFVFAFTTPAKADVSISGYIAMNTYIVDVDNPAPVLDDDDLVWNRDQWCSRLTFAFKEGPFGATVEIRPANTSYVRHWWGTWNFGAGTLGIGQFWTADFNPISTNKYDCGSISGPAGDPGGTVRANQIQLQLGGFTFAAIEPFAVPFGAPFVDVDTSMPKIVARYKLNVAMVGLNIFAGYQSYDVVNAADVGYGVDSYLFGVSGSAVFGPLTVAAQINTQQNPVEYSPFAPHAYAASWDGSKIVDVDYMSYGLDFIFRASDAWTITAGFNTGTSELDLPGTWEDEVAAYHVNATWRVAKNVYITPEYAVVDYKDYSDTGTTKAEEPVETYMGVYWRITF